MNFQDPATVIMENIIDLHHDIFYYLVLTTVFIVYILMRILISFNFYNKTVKRDLNLTHHSLIEFI